MGMLNKCCHCISLHDGCIIIAYLLLVQKSIQFIISCVSFISYCGTALDNPMSYFDSDFTLLRAVNVIMMIIQVAEIMLAILLIEGSREKNREKLKGFIVGALIAYTLYFFLFFLSVGLFASTYTVADWACTSTEIVLGVIDLYFILIVRSCYVKMGEIYVTPQETGNSEDAETPL